MRAARLIKVQTASKEFECASKDCDRVIQEGIQYVRVALHPDGHFPIPRGLPQHKWWLLVDANWTIGTWHLKCYDDHFDSKLGRRAS
jgi:hypothetical protein